MPDAETLNERGRKFVVPRSVTVVVVLGVLVFVGADIAAQFIIPGHTANPLIDGPLVALLASILVGSKGPKPDPADPDPAARAVPIEPAGPAGPGRHRGGDPE